MNIRTLATAFALAALFGLTAAPARAQTAAPEVAPPPADAQAAPAKPKSKANMAGAPDRIAAAASSQFGRHPRLGQLIKRTRPVDKGCRASRTIWKSLDGGGAS